MASQSSPTRPTPRIIMYYQTTHDPDGNLISTLPLITQPGISLTHLIVAAIHINEDPDGLTLNDHSPSDPRYTTMWAELRIAQASDIKVLGMLGGAAKGSFTRLDQDQRTFEKYYAALSSLIQERDLDGLDLDVEEDMSLAGIVRLIDRLRADFGSSFLITLAPVAAALLDPRRNLSGFDYEALEVMRGPQIAWYNAQFYCGWGDAGDPAMYQLCVARGWPAEKVVVGLVTTPENGPGWVPLDVLAETLRRLRALFPAFGGVMGWEYFNGLPGGKARPWEWARDMTGLLRGEAVEGVEGVGGKGAKSAEIDPDVETGPSLLVPQSFEYYSDGLGEGDD
ncbi:glycoside hydrolase family 18 protein [Annulohypoxylon maeteangense]|uniref:glycoside hydrolase family 18 protein n=1 Tax=Annulohypoxylon maeteangense TaxID=1927788 RepID=UPI002007B007|nr:glycoside hydrolase family 18 protein [Annulohypoxylon maeteangense]KAI0881087.1 glycoside hydrolase family 18 protein [Annulohypoxylon maeteangense]